MFGRQAVISLWIIQHEKRCLSLHTLSQFVVIISNSIAIVWKTEKSTKKNLSLFIGLHTKVWRTVSLTVKYLSSWNISGWVTSQTAESPLLNVSKYCWKYRSSSSTSRVVTAAKYIPTTFWILVFVYTRLHILSFASELTDSAVVCPTHLVTVTFTYLGIQHGSGIILSFVTWWLRLWQHTLRSNTAPFPIIP